MSVLFKAYLYEGRACRSKEIRKFAIDQDVSTNYDYLRNKVSNIFPNLGDNFALQWRDSEGDLIWFNSDEELFQALSQHTDGEFKLFVKEQNVNASSQQCPRRQYCGPRFSRCPPPFGFYPGMFANCPFKFAPDNKEEQKNETPSTSKAEENKEANSEATEYLQEMGKAVAEFLQPFGIDVDINVESKKEDSSDASKSKADDDESKTSSEDKPAEATKPNESQSASSSWTFVNNEKSEESRSTSNEDKMEVDEDARLREAVDRLLGMGFNDHGGWLTNLLKSCGGDIGRALDAMQPNRSKKN